MRMVTLPDVLYARALTTGQQIVQMFSFPKSVPQIILLMIVIIMLPSLKGKSAMLMSSFPCSSQISASSRHAQRFRPPTSSESRPTQREQSAETGAGSGWTAVELDRNGAHGLGSTSCRRDADVSAVAEAPQTAGGRGGAEPQATETHSGFGGLARVGAAVGLGMV